MYVLLLLLVTMIIQVQVAVCSCEEALYQKQEMLNIALVELGELSAILIGITKILLWFVDSWDSQLQVVHIKCMTVCIPKQACS